MLNTPFSPWPCFSQEEIDAVAAVLRSGYVNYWTGQECRAFEREFAEFAGTEFAVALANGTVALDVALKALGIGPGDEVVVTSRTFLASASAIVNAGAQPVFADVDRDSQNITAETIELCLTARTRAIICVHLAGMPCDMDAIMALAREHRLAVIEDCAQAHGATYKGRPVGSIGDIGAWSFCQDKIMTTGGEGGMVTTNDRSLWEYMWSYKDHGKSWQAVYERGHPPGFRWLHESLGTNWRMTEMQAALGRIQLRRMPQWSIARRRNAERIWKCANSLPGLRVPLIPDDTGHAAYKCYVFVEPEQLKADWSRDRIVKAINDGGVPCYTGSCSEVYLEAAFQSVSGPEAEVQGEGQGQAPGAQRLGKALGAGGVVLGPENRLPVAQELGETSLMFLVHPTLTDAEMEKTCAVLAEVMRGAAVAGKSKAIG